MKDASREKGCRTMNVRLHQGTKLGRSGPYTEKKREVLPNLPRPNCWKRDRAGTAPKKSVSKWDGAPGCAQTGNKAAKIRGGGGRIANGCAQPEKRLSCLRHSRRWPRNPPERVGGRRKLVCQPETPRRKSKRAVQKEEGEKQGTFLPLGENGVHKTMDINTI